MTSQPEPDELTRVLGKLAELDEAASGFTRSYDSLRTFIGDARDAAKKASPLDRTRELSLGLVYDAMGWTEPTTALSVVTMNDLLQAVLQAFRGTASQETFLAIRSRLVHAGFCVSPPDEPHVKPPL